MSVTLVLSDITYYIIHIDVHWRDHHYFHSLLLLRVLQFLQQINLFKLKNQINSLIYFNVSNVKLLTNANTSPKGRHSNRLIYGIRELTVLEDSGKR
jgi:hypothetical protein